MRYALFMLLVESFTLIALLILLFRSIFQPENTELGDIVKSIIFGVFYLAMQFDTSKRK